jgi:ketosteroid isomerase-like protein
MRGSFREIARFAVFVSMFTATSVARAALPDSTDVVRVVSRFHAVLVSGDSAGALALLAPDALIIEAGTVETRAEYRSHHLPADIEFAGAVPSPSTVVRVSVDGRTAWVTSTSVTRGQFKTRAIDSVGAELMVLTKRGKVWTIAAIHWSSRKR